MKVPASRLDRGFEQHKSEYEKAALEVLNSGWYVLGPKVSEFERQFADYLGRKYCVGLASGLDALILAFRALDIKEGDEVLVQGNTYIASVMGITINGATPIIVEPDEFYNIDVSLLESKITERTKAILVVHLYGQATKMDEILALCKKYKLRLVEDCAQSHGACFDDKITGSFGDIGCFSFYPSKNLGAFGDAGAIVTDDEVLADRIKMYRNYGSKKRYYNEVVGINSRLDELQAALLSIRLKYIEEMNSERRAIAKRYLAGITNPLIKLPTIRENCTHVWHQFVIRCEQRDELMEYLAAKEIGTIIHYPVPPHLSQAYEYLGHGAGSYPVTENYANSVLSLPMFNGMTEEEQDYVICAINDFGK